MSKTKSGFFYETYTKAFETIKKETGIDVRLKFYPTKRALESFKDKKVFGVFPAFEANFPDLQKIKSLKLGLKQDALFVLKGKELEKIKQKENYKAAKVRYYHHSEKILEDCKGRIIGVDNMEAGLKMLLAERVQILIGDTSTTFELIKKWKVKDVVALPIDPKYSTPAHLFVQKSKIGIKFMDALNQYIIKNKLYEAFEDFIQTHKSLDEFSI